MWRRHFSEGHDSIMKVTNRSLKGCLDYILGWHSDLIIVAEAIHEWKHSMLNSWINEHIHVGKWKFIFGACFIMIPKVHTASYLPFLLLDWYDVWKPPWMHDRLNKPSCEKFWISWIIWASTSGWKVRMGYTTGIAPGSTLRAYATRLGSKLDISWHFQAKTSTYSFNSEMSWAFFGVGKVAFTEVGCWTWGSSLRLMVSSSTSGEKLVTTGGFSNSSARLLGRFFFYH